jgi:hypothetical protein
VEGGAGGFRGLLVRVVLADDGKRLVGDLVPGPPHLLEHGGLGGPAGFLAHRACDLCRILAAF